MIFDAKFVYGDKILDVKVSLGLDTVFLFSNSLPDNVVPKVGDEIILDFEDAQLIITSVVSLVTGQNNEWDNYALKVEVK